MVREWDVDDAVRMFARVGRRAARAGALAACAAGSRPLRCDDASLGPAPAHKKPTPKAPPALEAYKEPAGSAGAGAPVARDAAPDLLQLVEARDVEGLAALVGSENFDASALDARNADGLTPLLVAARMRDPKAAELLRVLIARGADLDAPDKLGRSALHLAALAGNAAAARVLLTAGADVARADARRGATAAHYASAFARVDTIRLLCAAAPDQIRDARDSLGRSPLHWSALSAHRDWASPGSFDVVSALVDAGSSVRARDKTGATPAHSAARLGADAFLDHLVRCDTRAADAKPTNHARPLLHECDNRGVSPLDIMVARYRVSRVKAKFLLDAPFDLPSFGLAISFPKFWESGAPPKA